MIPYRLLPPAEEEMTEAALFYERAAAGLGDDFLDDVQFAVDSFASTLIWVEACRMASAARSLTILLACTQPWQINDQELPASCCRKTIA